MTLVKDNFPSDVLKNKPQVPEKEFQTEQLICVLVLIWVLYGIATRDKRRNHSPPGPNGYPLIGNLLSLRNADKIPDIIRQWAKYYGPIVYTRMGASGLIWLNNGAIVKELMDKRGQKYSSRARMPMAFQATSNQNRIIFMPYGDRWRNLRKFSHSGLNLKASATYKPIQDFESKQLLFELLGARDDTSFYDINRRYSASVIMTVTYGHRVSDWNDPHIKKIYKVLEHFTLMSEPGAWLVDAFPSLAALPSWMVQNWWKIGREWFKYDREVYLSLYRNFAKSIEEETAPDCFVRDFYENDPEKKASTKSRQLMPLILACQLFPEVVRTAQEELDRVVGPDRLPSFEDEDQLPYIRCMVKETLRWWPITKTGMMHATSEDDWYDGHFIPKGSAVMLNWW